MTKPALLAALLVLAASATAQAAATPVATATRIDAHTFILDASASPCHNGGCDFSWRVYRIGGNRLGATLGYGPTITATFPLPGIYQIVVTESEYCAPGGGSSRRSCAGSFQVNVSVT